MGSCVALLGFGSLAALLILLESLRPAGTHWESNQSLKFLQLKGLELSLSMLQLTSGQ